MEFKNDDTLIHLDVQLDDVVQKNLSIAARWTKFIAVLMFVFCGILLIAAVLGSAAILTAFEKLDTKFSSITALGSGVIIGIIFITVVLIGAIFYFMFKFSTNIKKGLMAENILDVNDGIKSLKIYFIISAVIGIITILFSLFSLFNLF